MDEKERREYDKDMKVVKEMMKDGERRSLLNFNNLLHSFKLKYVNNTNIYVK